ncbi:MAG: RNase adapter RapZ [Thermoanaerobaculia bacterium]|nr:RNase adapter RapZ [Thermoanaerobaculia bacterium]
MLGSVEPNARAGRPQLVLLTGLSGSGKSSVAKCFEDLGFYVVDNLPLPLLRQFLDDPLAFVDGWDRIAVVTDIRAPGFAHELPVLFREIDRVKVDPVLVFLEASNETLLRRFSETRRPHPLAGDRPLLEGIKDERAMLADLRGLADIVLDSSEWTIHEIRSQIYREFASSPGASPSMVVSLVSFGFKHGIPQGTDLLFDLRYLPNPHFVPGLREKTGKDAPVREFLEAQPEFPELLGRLEDLLLYLLPRYRRENRSYLTVAIGCTGGQHRSVAAVEALCERLAREDWAVRAIHRDAAS